MNQNIKGKVIVITGASSGLGEATAIHLAALGANLVLGARRADRINALADKLSSGSVKVFAQTTDVTDRNQVQSLVDLALTKFGHVDVMINNAGVMPQSMLESLKIDDWDSMIDVNINTNLKILYKMRYNCSLIFARVKTISYLKQIFKKMRTMQHNREFARIRYVVSI